MTLTRSKISKRVASTMKEAGVGESETERDVHVKRNRKFDWIIKLSI